jgi:hypothetical protein
MIHARNTVQQELVAITLAHYKIPMVQWSLHNAAREMATMKNGMADFKGEVMAVVVVGAKLTSEDRWSLGCRYSRRMEDVDSELMKEFNITDWAVASPEQNETRQEEWTAGQQRSRSDETGGSGESNAYRGGFRG